MTEQPLVVDRATTAIPLSDDEVRGWAATRRIFVSSVIEGMGEERRAAVETISRIGAEPVWFEGMGGRDQDAEQAYLSEVAASDIYVGLLGSRYGRPDALTGYSATHAEFLHAVENGLRIAVWNLDTENMTGHQRDFLNEIRTYFVTGDAMTYEDLRPKIEDRLRRIAAEELAPWCILGSVAFRATEITDNGRTVTIDALVRDPDVEHALTAMRPNGQFRQPGVRVVFGDMAANASVSLVEVTQSSGATRRFRLTLEREHHSDWSPMTEASYNVNGRNYSPGDLTEIALRRVLFDEPSPFQHDLGFTEMPDPVAPLRSAGVQEDALRPILRLLVVHSLIGSGRASRVTRLLLGPKANGVRKLLVEWEPRRRPGSDHGRHLVEGVCRL
jgi:hypothetical protein